MIRDNITFAGNPVVLIGEEIAPGDKAPEFEAVNSDLSPFHSSEYDGKIRIYSVVPSVDTGVCAMQTTKFNEEAANLSDDVVIITISNDLPFAQERFCSNAGIDRAIIVSDYQKHDFGMKYGFLIDGLALLSRGVVVVDRDNEVKYVEYVQEVTDHPDYEQALEAAKALVE